MENIVATFAGFVFDQQNPAKSLPGAYLLRNRLNGKCYVGISQNVKRRLREHERGRGFAPVLMKAIRKYGPDQFEASPLFYSITGTDCLPAIEADLIATWQGIGHGYNVQACSGSVGPYGPLFGQAIKRSHAKPETRDRLRAAAAARMKRPGWAEAQAIYIKAAHTPEARIKLSASLRRFHASKTPEEKLLLQQSIQAIMRRPGFLEKRGASLSATLQTPEGKAKRSAHMKAVMANHATRAKISASTKATMATGEFKAKRSAIMVEIHSRPDVKARHSASVRAAYLDPEVARKIGASKLGRVWATNGAVSRLLPLGAEMPEGWRRGLLKKAR